MIKIIDNLYLDANENEFQLVEWDGRIKYDNKQKKDLPAYTTIMHFSDFESLVKKLHILCLRRNIVSSKDLDELAQKYKETMNIIKKFIEDVNQR